MSQMKKGFLLLLCIVFLASFSSVAAASSSNKTVNVEINGVKVFSKYHHVYKDKLYVDLDAYSKILGFSYKISKGKAEVKGKKLTIRYKSSTPTVELDSLADATKAEKVSYSDKKNNAYVLDLPDGVIQISPSVPGMGEHWADPKDLPLGPIYGVYENKLVFLEQMVAQKDFEDGKNHVDIDGMQGLPSPSVQHSDIEFVPHGHEGFEVPHFDIHHYFVTHDEHLDFK